MGILEIDYLLTFPCTVMSRVYSINDLKKVQYPVSCSLVDKDARNDRLI